MYTIIPTLSEETHDAEVMVVQCPTLAEAISLAGTLTDDTGESFSVLQTVLKTTLPEPEPEVTNYSELYGLQAGVDYPCTL